MKDMTGKPLKVGDCVILGRRTDDYTCLGIIAKFTNYGITAKTFNQDDFIPNDYTESYTNIRIDKTLTGVLKTTLEGIEEIIKDDSKFVEFVRVWDKINNEA